MKKIDWLITIATFAFSYLFYRQITGLNYLVFTFLLTGSYLVLNPKLIANKNWVLFTITSIVSSFFVFWNHSNLAVWAVVCSLLLQTSYAAKGNASVISSGFYSIYSIGGSMVFLILNLIKRNEERSEKINSKKGINSLIGLGVFLVVLVFFFIYKNANPLFEKYTEKINLDFISIAWIFFTLMGFFIIYGLIRAQRIKAIDDFEDSILLILTNSGKTSKSFEKPAGIVLFVVLNSMLLLINCLDVIYLYVLKQLPEGITHAQFVHNGVGMIILSIILGIIIILLLFRNALNFESNTKAIKFLVALWIMQNLMMVISTCVRNQIYVNEFNLTYKRIGVFVYLLLACIGLITTLYKVYYKKSNWYLVKINSAIGVLFLCLAASIDWDKLILEFNIQHKQANIAALDKKYLLSLSEINIPYLQKIKSNKSFNTDSAVWYDTRGIDRSFLDIYNYGYSENSDQIDDKTYAFLKKMNEYQSWQSYNQRDRYILDELKNLNETKQLKSFSLKNQYIDSLGLLKIINNVETIDFTGSNGVSYDFLGSFNYLTDLNLNNNQLSSLNKIPAIKKLENLNIGNNSISGFSEINKFTRLSSLAANSNEIKNVSSFPYNNTIKYLNLDNNNQLHDLSGLIKLKQLQNLSVASLRRIDKFPETSKLETLTLNSIEEINRTLQHIPILPSLQYLDLNTTQGLYLSNLIVYNKETKSNNLRFPNLKTITLFSNQLNEIIALQYYIGLENIYLSNNNLKDISVFSSHEKINVLDVSNNSLETLNFNEHHQSIKNLSITNNLKISNFDDLKHLQFLEILDVSNTHFEDLKKLTCYTTLKSISIIDCSIKNIQELLAFKNIETIYMSDLSIKDAMVLTRLPKLQNIYIKLDYRNEKTKADLKKILKNKNINFI